MSSTDFSLCYSNLRQNAFVMRNWDRLYLPTPDRLKDQNAPRNAKT